MHQKIQYLKKNTVKTNCSLFNGTNIFSILIFWWQIMSLLKMIKTNESLTYLLLLLFCIRKMNPTDNTRKLWHHYNPLQKCDLVQTSCKKQHRKFIENSFLFVTRLKQFVCWIGWIYCNYPLKRENHSGQMYFRLCSILRCLSCWYTIQTEYLTLYSVFVGQFFWGAFITFFSCSTMIESDSWEINSTLKHILPYS